MQHEQNKIDVLFIQLSERHERGSVMITSNLPFSQWDHIFQDPMTAAAAGDRLVHHNIILKLNIAGYRMEPACAGTCLRP